MTPRTVPPDLLHNNPYAVERPVLGVGRGLTPRLTPQPRSNGSERRGVRPFPLLRPHERRPYGPTSSSRKPGLSPPVSPLDRPVRPATPWQTRRTWEQLPLNQLGYLDNSDEPRLPPGDLRLLSTSPAPSWLLLIRRPALRSPTARAAAVAGAALTAAGAAVLGPVELTVGLAHLATTGANPLGVTAVLLAAFRIWRHYR